MRHSEVSRETAETAVKLSLELDGSGRSDIDTGVGFLDHMLTLLALPAKTITSTPWLAASSSV